MPYQFDPEQVALALQEQELSPGWLVMWGPYRRIFTAWHAADPAECRVVHARDLDGLRAGMTEAEFRWASRLPQATAPPTPKAVAPEVHRAQPRGPQSAT